MRRLAIPSFNPVFADEQITTPPNNPNTNRPVPRVMRTIYFYNEAVRRLDDWNLPTLDFPRMVDDTLAFDASLFATNLPAPRNSLSATTAANSEREVNMQD